MNREKMIEKAAAYWLQAPYGKLLIEIMADFALSLKSERLKVADMRELDKKVASGEISYSRMVELINEHFGLLPELPRKEERRRNECR